jgi:hypothetical protein
MTTVTITEFMYPFRHASQKDQVQAALYYGKHFAGDGHMTATEIRAALAQARIPGTKGHNITRSLTQSTPHVHQGDDRRRWEITATGERHLRETYSVPDPTSPVIESDVAALQALAARVGDEATRGYIEESILCLRVGARRASVVFLWTGAVASIRDVVWRQGAQAIEKALQSRNPKAKFKKKTDFENVKDSDLLQIAQDFEIYDKSQKKRLGEALDLRNDCGHPVKYRPGEKKVASLIEDLVSVVWP